MHKPSERQHIRRDVFRRAMLSFSGRSMNTTRGFHFDNVSKSDKSSPEGILLNRIFVVIIYTLAKPFILYDETPTGL
jgi:hypothetical protein